MKKYLAQNQKLLPGIIGGIGPLSHTDFERYLLSENKDAKVDQEHISYVLVSATSIPSRPLAVEQEQQGNNVLSNEVEEKLMYYANLLADDGADFIVILCNGAHFWYERVRQRIPIPWIHIMETTAEYIKKQHPSISQVGVLATDATLRGQLYQKAFQQRDLHVIAPDIESSTQKDVMKAIYDEKIGIKATGARVDKQAIRLLYEASNYLKDQGAQMVIAGCTEISIALPGNYDRLPVVDPMQVLARKVISLALRRDSL